MPDETVYSCLEPRGDYFDIELLPPSKRIAELNSKTIYFVDNGKQGSKFVLKTALGLMEKSFPDAKLVYYPKTTPFHRPESEDWWNEINNNADAVLVSLGD